MKERKPILEHYQAFYDSIPKKPKSQQIKKRPRLLGMKEDAPTERVASDSLGSPKAMIELKVSPSGHQMDGKRSKINLGDFRSGDLFEKIRSLS